MTRKVTIGGDEHEGMGSGDFHSDALDESPEHGWLTADEVKRAFGYDDATIAAHVKAKNLLVHQIDGLTLYKMKPVPVDTFTQIVLHEIGHSVDDMLGGHTAAVFEYAGWREFNDNQFDAWAGEMGGWERVSAPDKARIRQAWIDTARVNRSVHDLVGADHPALANDYADVGIVAMGREKRSSSAWHRDITNGRMFIAGSYPGRWYSVDAAIVPSAPSYYSLFAPHELLAELLVAEHDAAAQVIADAVDERRVVGEHARDVGDEPGLPRGPVSAIARGRDVEPLVEIDVGVHHRLLDLDRRVAGRASTAMKPPREDVVASTSKSTSAPSACSGITDCQSRARSLVSGIGKRMR
jgi:hypothetical protein